MEDSFKLRSSFQFDRVEEQRKRLAGRIASASGGPGKLRLAVESRAIEACLLWLGQERSRRRILRFLRRRKRGWKPLRRDVPLERVVLVVDTLADAAQKKTGLDSSLLGKVNALLVLSTDDHTGYRTAAITPAFGGHTPFAPEDIAPGIERSIEWFESEGARQLHPLERSALALARFTEIWPFDGENLLTAMVVASYYAVAEGYPFPLIYPSESALLVAALQSATSLHMQPLVDILVRVESELLAELHNAV